MNRLLAQLPGVAMPVDEVTRTLRHMWDTEPGKGANPTDFRASQMNLILHFGLETTADEAQKRFDTAIRFAQRYPSRIIVLCPTVKQSGEMEFEGKLFSQCYIGKHLRDICCCEALLLGYSPEQSDFLESQVSIWLETDLPIYHWLHRVPPERITDHYRGFLNRCRGIIYDRAIDDYGDLDWPDPNHVKDLALAHTLPLRQHIGQFLSGFDPDELVEELVSLDFQYNPKIQHLAWNLLKWHRLAIEKCHEDPDEAQHVQYAFAPFPKKDSPDCLKISWIYKDPGKILTLHYKEKMNSGMIVGKLPTGTLEHALHVEPLTDEAALAEAMFFG